MKKVIESKELVSNLDHLASKLTEKKVLNLNAMKSIKGGEGEDNGGSDIIMPKPK